MIRDNNNNTLVFDTFDNAIVNNPDAHPLYHSGRGFQYTNQIFYNKLEEAGMAQNRPKICPELQNVLITDQWKDFGES